MMGIFFILIIGILFCILFIKICTRSIDSVINFIAISKDRKHPDSMKRAYGIVINKKTKKVEGDSKFNPPL